MPMTNPQRNQAEENRAPRLPAAAVPAAPVPEPLDFDVRRCVKLDFIRLIPVTDLLRSGKQARQPRYAPAAKQVSSPCRAHQ